MSTQDLIALAKRVGFLAPGHPEGHPFGWLATTGTLEALAAALTRPDSAAPAGVEVDVVTAAIHQSCKALIRRYTEDNAGFIRMARDAAIDAVLALAAPKAPAAAQEPMWFDPHETARRRALQPPSAPKAEEVSPPAKCLIYGSETEHYECKPKADERGSAEPVGDVIDAFEADYNEYHLEPMHMADWFKKLRAATAPARAGSEPGLRQALTRVLPIFEKVSRDLVFTGDKAGQFIADMQTLKGAATPEQRAVDNLPDDYEVN